MINDKNKKNMSSQNEINSNSDKFLIIKDYKGAISVGFDSVIYEKNSYGKKNLLYCYDTITNFNNHLNNIVDENNSTEIQALLKNFNDIICNLLSDIVQLFMAYNKFNEANPDPYHINVCDFNVRTGFNLIKGFVKHINYYIGLGDNAIGAEIQNHFISNTKALKFLLIENFYINIDLCQIKVDIDDVINELQISLDINDLLAKQKLTNQSKSLITSKNKISIPEIALKYFYEDLMPITRDNSDNIAKKYDYISKKSGEGLYQDYTHYCKRTNRKGDPGSLIKLNNKITLLTKVIEILPANKKKKAIDELAILKGFLKNY